MRDSRRGGFRRDTRRGGREDRAPREMFDAKCANCGKDCKIPFQPRNDKPVYCSDCYEKFGGKNDRPRFDRGGSRGGSRDGSDLREISQKLDKIIELLTKKP